ncbi:MAG: hypothetical protein NC827_04940 [Candidatus Omnitrophica bacterium]|nr:hypothetical protein [Candidatus Omnitrophota bacterium]MCM8802638.1 hypothetical protein [Candidatus Omnitrophota bacterium]
MGKLKYQMKCDSCKRIANINVQKVWIKWRYNPTTGEYSKKHELLYDMESAQGEENLHFCNKCFNKWRNGEIK